MVSSKATTPKDYLAGLEAGRRAEIQAVRQVILKNLPKGMHEGIGFGMLTYYVPLSRYPDTYNKQPIGPAALAAQKNYNSLYLMACYSNSAMDKALRDAFKKAGKKLDMGQCCVRFKRAADLDLPVIGKIIKDCSVEKMIAIYEESRKKIKA